jgi:glycosyltransferase involved in cell wall biosynthesis
VTETAPASSHPLRVFVASAAEFLTDHATHGEGLIASQLFSRLAERGHELVLCARHAEFSKSPGFRVVEIGAGCRFESIEPLGYARRVNRLLQREGAFDVVHWLFPTEPVWFAPPSGGRFFIGPRLACPPEQGRSLSELRAGDLVRGAGAPYLSYLRRRAFARAERIFLSVPAAVSEVPARFHAKTVVLPFGVDEHMYPLQPLPEQARILYLGRLEYDKGVRDLLEAFSRVHVDYPESRLVFAGDGGDRPWLERRVRELRLEQAVSLVGAIRHERTAALLGDADVVCLPSHREAYGMAILEAMSCGRAIVSVDTGGPAFLVDAPAGGRLVPRRDPQALAAALTDVLSDPAELESMGRFNRRRVEEVFSLDGTVDALEQHYFGRA